MNIEVKAEQKAEQRFEEQAQALLAAWDQQLVQAQALLEQLSQLVAVADEVRS